MEPTHLSSHAHQRLLDELEERTTTRRLEISAWIERAREHGDIRENADYDAAKNEQGHNEARVRQLQTILKHAIVLDGREGGGDTVAAGTLVEIRMDGDDETSHYLIGSIEERSGDFDVISPGSPLGSALLERSAGEVVKCEAPGGVFDVTIVSVRPAP